MSGKHSLNSGGDGSDGRIRSLLDTDLYKLTMQCCILKYFPSVSATYSLSNRTHTKRLNRPAVIWLQREIAALSQIRLTEQEAQFLVKTCPFLPAEYIDYLRQFRFKPGEHISVDFSANASASLLDNRTDEADNVVGNLLVTVSGLWVETTLYEIHLLALVSEAYFRFVSRDWNHDGQREQAAAKASALIAAGCHFSEFGTRRRRDYRTHQLVLSGLVDVARAGVSAGPGSLLGTSNVHFAMEFNLRPIGTVAHEMFMGVAAGTTDYENANELTLRCWINTFGVGVLPIGLTDTFGTPAFLHMFDKPIDRVIPPPLFKISADTNQDDASKGRPEMPESLGVSDDEAIDITRWYDQINADTASIDRSSASGLDTLADAFTGLRQDSGDPIEYVRLVKTFYDRYCSSLPKNDSRKNVTRRVVFSDSLNVKRCIEYKDAAEQHGLDPSFGIGTDLTNDFIDIKSNTRSEPMNIVMKLYSIQSRPAIKLSDDAGKVSGNPAVAEYVRRVVGYVDHRQSGRSSGDSTLDETARWT